MIARMWHGRVLKKDAEAYHQFLLTTGLADYKTTAGNRGVFVLTQDEDNITHYYTLTFWDDLDAIKRFAGDDYIKARYYPEDKDFLLEFEEKVNQFDVMEMPAYMPGKLDF